MRKTGLLLACVLPLAAACPAAAIPRYDHILIVVEENDDASFILGNENAPYFNKVLVPLGAVMTDSHGREHPSLPNYLVLFSGSAQGVNPKNIHQGLTGLDPSTQKPVVLPADRSAAGAGARFNADGSINTFVDPATHHVLVRKKDPIYQFGTDDPLPQTDNGKGGYTLPLTTPNLGAALLRAGKTFAGYSEDLLAITPDHPQADPLAVKNVDVGHGIDYVRKHNPWSNWVRADPTAQNHGLPPAVNLDFSAFPSMANSTSPDFSTLPTLVFVIPNEFHDGHGNKAIEEHSKHSVKALDDFLVRYIEPYRRWAASHNSLLIVTWDEDAFAVLKGAKGQLVDPAGTPVPVDANGLPTRGYFPNHIVTILAGAHVRAGSYDQHIDHCNLLRTIEVAEGLEPLASDGSTCDAHAEPISAPFDAR